MLFVYLYEFEYIKCTRCFLQIRKLLMHDLDILHYFEAMKHYLFVYSIDYRYFSNHCQQQHTPRTGENWVKVRTHQCLLCCAATSWFHCFLNTSRSMTYFVYYTEPSTTIEIPTDGRRKPSPNENRKYMIRVWHVRHNAAAATCVNGRQTNGVR